MQDYKVLVFYIVSLCIETITAAYQMKFILHVQCLNSDTAKRVKQ